LPCKALSSYFPALRVVEPDSEKRRRGWLAGWLAIGSREREKKKAESRPGGRRRRGAQRDEKLPKTAEVRARK
jgi:hypothetical protein